MKSREKNFPKIRLIAGVAILAIGVFVVLNWRPNSPQPNTGSTVATPSASPADISNITRSIKQGTQLHLSEDTDVAVGGIYGSSAWLYLTKRDVGSEKRDVAAGDKFEMYGYSFEVLAIRGNSSISLAPGSSNGYVKLLISKK